MPSGCKIRLCQSSSHLTQSMEYLLLTEKKMSLSVELIAWMILGNSDWLTVWPMNNGESPGRASSVWSNMEDHTEMWKQRKQKNTNGNQSRQGEQLCLYGCFSMITCCRTKSFGIVLFARWEELQWCMEWGDQTGLCLHRQKIRISKGEKCSFCCVCTCLNHFIYVTLV